MSDSMSNMPHEVWQLILYDDTDTPIRTFIMTNDTLTIGRELYHDIPLDDIRISKQHAQLTLNEAGQLIIEDLHSVNGTLVNNEPVIKPISLEPDDYVTLGPFIFKVVKGPPPAPESMGAVPESRVATQVHPIDAAPTPSSGWGRRMIVLTVVLVILLLIIVAGLTAGGFFLLGQFQEVAQTTPTPVTEVDPIAELEGANRPQVTINQAPADGDVLSANEPIIIQAVASDSQGISRLELWVNGTKVDQIVSQLAELAPSMSVAFQWTAGEPGEYGLEFRAYNAPGLAEIVPIGTVMIVGELQGTTPQPTFAPTDTPSPPTETPTITPIPETVVTVEEAPTITPTPVVVAATPAGVAALTITAPTLNVRAGPSVQYPLVGQLRQGQQLQITGQGDVGQGRWWQIPYAAAPGRVGWVIADSALVSAVNVSGVPLVPAPPLPTAVPTDTPPPAVAIGSQPIEPTPPPESTSTPTPPTRAVLRAPDGQTLVIISNRSIGNLPAVLTLSGGRTVGGGREIKAVPGIDEQIVLAPDSYRAQWSAPNGFARAFSFDAVAGKVMVMWAVPDTNSDDVEIYDELIVDGGEAADPTPTPESTSEAQPAVEGYTAPPGRALFVAGNRSLNNSFTSLTISGGSFGGGEEFTLDANTETPLELGPGEYRAVWTTPAGDGFTATRDFEAVAGQVIISYIVPEDGRVVVEFE